MMNLKSLAFLNRFFSADSNKKQNRSPQRKNSRRTRRLLGEQFESRELLTCDTLCFSEILFDPDPFSELDDQYVELRGEPLATIPQSTYLVVVDNDAFGNERGKVNSVFDLSGMQLGFNGFLVLAQGPNVYSFDQSSNVVSGTDGFGGIPGYANDTSVSNKFEHVFGSNTFLLIESPTQAFASADYDSNDDGVLDGAAANWTVLDSISVNGHHNDGSPDDAVYGDILFRLDGNQSTAPNGVETVDMRSGGYIARVGDRTGYTQADFVAGDVTTASDGQDLNIDHTPGNEVYREFVGSRLDHLGGVNFYSTITGSHYVDANDNGVPDSGEATAGTTYYIDVNDNGVHDSYQTVIEPDDFTDGEQIMKVVPGVTITAETNGEALDAFAPEVEQNSAATTGTQTIDVSIAALRLDFVHSVQSVSIDASNLGSSVTDIGSMTAYDVDGNVLASYQTDELVDAFETMTITRASSDIAMVRVFFDPIYSSFSDLDNIRFTSIEPFAVTDANGNYTIEKVDLHLGSDTVLNLRRTHEPLGVPLNLDVARSFGLPSLGVQPADIIGRTQDGEWWIARSDATSFSTEFYGEWSNVAWEDTVMGDFDGDRVADLAGRIGREWWVSLSSGQSLGGTQYWGAWPTTASWTDVQVADVNGDGLSDIVGRNAGGAWWVARSTGQSFAIEQWTHWSTNVTWEDTVVGDFNGDSRDDLAGRVNGTWYVDLSNGQQFEFQQWGAWSNAVTWEDVRVGDFDGDGSDDIAGRVNGQWWLANSTGTSFQTVYWGKWSNAVTWEDVVVGDFDGDGTSDIAGRTNGQWWLARSTGSAFSVEFWGRWSNSVAWENVVAGDFDGDGKTDIAGRANGDWWLARSTGSFFNVEYWGNWSTNAEWQAVSSGVLTQSSIGGFGVQLSDPTLDSAIETKASLKGRNASSFHVVEDGSRVRRSGRFQ